jgi:hypothetical protein
MMNSKHSMARRIACLVHGIREQGSWDEPDHSMTLLPVHAAPGKEARMGEIGARGKAGRVGV